MISTLSFVVRCIYAGWLTFVTSHLHFHLKWHFSCWIFCRSPWGIPLNILQNAEGFRVYFWVSMLPLYRQILITSFTSPSVSLGQIVSVHHSISLLYTLHLRSLDSPCNSPLRMSLLVPRRNNCPQPFSLLSAQSSWWTPLSYLVIWASFWGFWLSTNES